MKYTYLIPSVTIIGFIVLLLFPEPETNFLAYIGTFLSFLVLITILIVWQVKRK